jgi:hypothetical protein
MKLQTTQHHHHSADPRGKEDVSEILDIPHELPSLGLESPDLSPPFEDMYICDICNRTYHWQCLLKTSCCNATEREAIDTNISKICPACINLAKQSNNK